MLARSGRGVGEEGRAAAFSTWCVEARERFSHSKRKGNNKDFYLKAKAIMIWPWPFEYYDWHCISAIFANGAARLLLARAGMAGQEERAPVLAWSAEARGRLCRPPPHPPPSL